MTFFFLFFSFTSKGKENIKRNRNFNDVMAALKVVPKGQFVKFFFDEWSKGDLFLT